MSMSMSTRLLVTDMDIDMDTDMDMDKDMDMNMNMIFYEVNTCLYGGHSKAHESISLKSMKMFTL
jgi:hypothetical protein